MKVIPGFFLSDFVSRKKSRIRKENHPAGMLVILPGFLSEHFRCKSGDFFHSVTSEFPADKNLRNILVDRT